MAFEDLLLTSQIDSADRQRAVIAQAIRTYPDANVLKKHVSGPYKVTNLALPAVPGYRYFIHSVQIQILQVAGDTCTGMYVYSPYAGVNTLLCYAPTAAGVCVTAFNLLDVILEEGQGVTLAVQGVATYPGCTITYELVKAGDD